MTSFNGGEGEEGGGDGGRRTDATSLVKHYFGVTKSLMLSVSVQGDTGPQGAMGPPGTPGTDVSIVLVDFLLVVTINFGYMYFLPCIKGWN